MTHTPLFRTRWLDNMKKLLLSLAASLLCALPAFADSQSTPGLGWNTSGSNVTNDRAFVTVGNDPSLSNERAITAGTGLTGTDGGANSTYTIGLGSQLSFYNGLNILTQQQLIDAVHNLPSISSGDVIYYNGTNWVRLPAGGLNQVLSVTSIGPPIVLGWQNAGVGSGSITSSTLGQIPVFTAAQVLGGNVNFTYATGVVSIGAAGTQGQIKLLGTTSGTVTLTTAAAAGTPTVTLPTVNQTEPTALPAVSGGILNATTAGVQSYTNNSQFGGTAGSTLTLGRAANATGILSIVGTTSGNATVTVPAAAGTPTITLGTVNLTEPTALPAVNGGALNATTAGVQSYTNNAQFGGTSGSTLTLGRAANATGILSIVGTTSGNATITAPATAGTPTITLPTVNETGVTALPAANNTPLIESTTGVQSFPTNAAFTANTLTLGASGSANGNLVLGGTTAGGSCTLAPQSTFSSNQTTTLGVTTTMPTTQAPSNGCVLTATTAGVQSYSASPPTYFGGNGSDGAITTWSAPQINATTVTVSTTTGPGHRAIINATSTVTFNSGTVISMNGGGWGGASAAANQFSMSGSGPQPGWSGNSTLVGGGGGSGAVRSGGRGGGASLTLGGGNGGENQTGVTVFNAMGSGGGSGGNLNAGGANGGGSITICANGAVTANTGASLSVDGGAGGNNGVSARGASGGGGGGSIFVYSLTSITAAAGTMSCKGGDGGAGLTTGGGGGGGGAGQIVFFAPSITNNLVTATACAGGAAGTSASGAAGLGGNQGAVISIVGTPSMPLFALLENGGIDAILHSPQDIRTRADICHLLCPTLDSYAHCMSDTMDNEYVTGIADAELPEEFKNAA